ncbi:MAG: hypothetical protein AUK55_10910 [Syntrophobacteraceae bacterium CG2_30_61_12]|nr:MAG: hypothetical protein AUK55_10910 [Syntrophobacteraceae bacterium CG2_30_61_12]
MLITDEKIGDVVVLKLKGRLDASSAPKLKEQVKSLIGNDRHELVIDFAEVDFIDSSGLGVLVSSHRSVNRAGGDIRLSALQDRVRAVVELTRLHYVFEIFEDAVTAAESF